MKAFSHHGAFMEFVDKKAHDEQVQKQYTQAHRVLQKKEAPWWQATVVDDADEVKVTCILSLVGPSRSDLVNLLGGTTPEELGVKLEWSILMAASTRGCSCRTLNALGRGMRFIRDPLVGCQLELWCVCFAVGHARNFPLFFLAHGGCLY